VRVPQSDPAVLPDELAFRRSLRRSQARRAAAAITRRRRLRSRTSVLAAVAGLAVAAGGATAQEAAAPAAGSGGVKAAQQALGIPADGIAGPQTRRAVRRFERRSGLPVDGLLDPQVLAALGVTATTATKAAASAAAQRADAPALLEAIALCESGGDPGAISANGRYRGKYQFTRSTWRTLGGSGDPAAADESEQDQRAAALLARDGTSPWPVCSRQVGAG
jgi:hypothetical protein